MHAAGNWWHKQHLRSCLNSTQLCLCVCVLRCTCVSWAVLNWRFFSSTTQTIQRRSTTCPLPVKQGKVSVFWVSVSMFLWQSSNLFKLWDHEIQRFVESYWVSASCSNLFSLHEKLIPLHSWEHLYYDSMPELKALKHVSTQDICVATEKVLILKHEIPALMAQ